MSFWNTSTLDQKLAQIEGAIECGLTQEQTATNLGTSVSTLKRFLETNSVSFPKKNTFEIGQQRQEQLDKLKQDYFSGAKKDFWYGRG